MTVAGETHRCPPPEVLAAFIDGRLPRLKVVALTEHLSSCAECRFIVESASELEAEEQAAETSEPQGRRSWRWMSIAAVVGAGLLVTPYARMAWQAHDGKVAVRDLAEVRLQKRLIEPRLTAGVDTGPWLPTRSGNQQQDEDVPKDQSDAETKAYEVLIRNPDSNQSADACHARGIAWLVLRKDDQAIVELTKATKKQPKDAEAWSDLAAGYLQKRQNDKAITAANRALALDPKLNEARFNKAIAKIRFKPAETIREWNDYLKHDPAGLWANEATRNIELARPFP